MNEIKGTAFGVTCGNKNCRLSIRVIGTADTEDGVYRSIRNPINLQYCPACGGGNTLFTCGECHEWHPMRHLLNKPYVCPKEVSQAVEKYNSTLIPFTTPYLAPVLVWLAQMLVVMFFMWPKTEVVSIRLLDYELWSMIIIPVLWLIGGSWTRAVNKKRKTQFVKEFPIEWGLVQRFPNGLN